MLDRRITLSVWPSASLLLCLFCLLCAGAARAQTPAPADDILKKVDQKANAFKDATFYFKLRIKEPDGSARELEFECKQKGTQKRLVRFLAPGDIKGTGILVESADVMYAMLPSLNRVRRLGKHVKGQSFFGTDLDAEDIWSIEFGAVYTAKLAGTDGALLLLQLSLKAGKESEFSRLKMWVNSKSFVVSKIEYYDNAGKKLRTQERQDFRDGDGGSYLPYKLVFTDHRRDNHQTELLLQKVQVNQGLGDDEFTIRSLERM